MCFPPFGQYHSGCPECDATKDLSPCECGAVFYCGPAHKKLHHKTHKRCCCQKIIKARQQYEAAKNALPPSQAECLDTINVLEIDPVNLKEGRDQAFEKCLEDRHALARALRAARTRQALEESATYLKWNTILRPDTLDLAAPRVVASYLIRTNRDDECHGFLRQYTLAICRSKGWLSDEEMANERSSDPWNDTDLLHSPFVPTAVLLFATLIKLRMLRELQMFDKIDGAVSDFIGHRLPLELLELVRSHLHDNPILASTRTSRRSNYEDGIYHVKAQIDRLWWEVRQRCKYIWPYLLDHRVMLRPECCRHNHRMGHTGCTFCNLQDVARFNIEDAWKQSPGALDYIAEMAFKHDAACLVSDDDFMNLRATF